MKHTSAVDLPKPEKRTQNISTMVGGEAAHPSGYMFEAFFVWGVLVDGRRTFHACLRHLFVPVGPGPKWDPTITHLATESAGSDQDVKG